MDLIGKVLAGRYEIVEKIGEGGMAYVFKARDNLLNRYVAVKVLKKEYSEDETFVKRFRTEAQSAASLTHPNIVSVYDVGEDNGVSYIVMELLESKTLKDYIEEKGPLSSDLTLKIAAQIASALEAAHKAHIVHRDIKPQNIILNKNLVAKVTDFGIAKVTNVSAATITSFGSTMGSVHYFSPEHAKGGYTDAKSDLYSLGVVMYEMATGRLPFDGESAVSVALKQIQEEPKPPIEVNPNVSPALNQIILKAMEKSTAKRYQTATEMLTDISVALSNPNTSLATRTQSSVEAGATQVIPTLDNLNDESSMVPNVRTRSAGPRSGYSKQVNTIQDSDLNKENEDKKVNKEKDAKKKKRIIAIVIVLVVVLGSVLGYTVKKVVDKNKVEEVEIPNIVGSDIDKVKQQYEAQGYEISQSSSEYNSDYAENQIISQDPVAGTKTTSKKISVVVSKGTKMVTVTDVTGKAINSAKYQLETTLGFIVEEEDVVSDTVAEGIVISQDYKDEDRPYGSIIKLTVSKGDGKEKVIVPNVVGKKEADATKELEDLKLSVKIEYGEDVNKMNGVVLSQSYATNTTLKEGDLITLEVNRRQINKTITVTGIPAGIDKSDITLNVSIDGGASNAVQFSYDEDKNQITFTINGYEKVSYEVSVKGNLIKSGEENF